MKVCVNSSEVRVTNVSEECCYISYSDCDDIHTARLLPSGYFLFDEYSGEILIEPSDVKVQIEIKKVGVKS